MQIITLTDLNYVIDRINVVTKNPLTPFKRVHKKASLVACIGNYHLDSAYGGHRLVQTTNEGGGIRVIIGGFVSKREIYERMQAFLKGIEAANG